jgi:hypothetical protein
VRNIIVGNISYGMQASFVLGVCWSAEAVRVKTGTLARGKHSSVRVEVEAVSRSHLFWRRSVSSCPKRSDSASQFTIGDEVYGATNE